MPDLEALTAADFAPLVHEPFRIDDGGGSSFTVELIDVSETGATDPLEVGDVLDAATLERIRGDMVAARGAPAGLLGSGPPSARKASHVAGSSGGSRRTSAGRWTGSRTHSSCADSR